MGRISAEQSSKHGPALVFATIVTQVLETELPLEPTLGILLMVRKSRFLACLIRIGVHNVSESLRNTLSVLSGIFIYYVTPQT